MIDLGAELRRASLALEEAGADFAVVGGLAVAIRANPRLTRDADLAVAVGSDAEAEALLSRLQAAGYTVAALVEHDPSGRLATARLQHTASPELFTDLLFCSSGIEAEIVLFAEVLEVLPGLELPVASLGHLIAMKLLARDDRHRPADADDLLHLHGLATDADWDTAAEALRLILERGFARGRDLMEGLATLRLSGPYGDNA